MGHVSQVKEMLNAEANNSNGTYPFPVAKKCPRKPASCAAFWYDRRCKGKACPWRETPA